MHLAAGGKSPIFLHTGQNPLKYQTTVIWGKIKLWSCKSFCFHISAIMPLVMEIWKIGIFLFV